ncbi:MULTISPECIES: enoyl-CoA hydratase/isomerase family protein [unclassified Streptomyces]|uniref:enoyl-CoA hydratase/isomerase family protein n=1 Tax=Streptomyces sp. NPDC005955 TaxID=3364738 RepID=UPI0036785CE5
MNESLTDPVPAARRPATLGVVRDGAVLRVRLDRPDTGNAVTEAMLDDLLSVLVDPDPGIRVIVLSAAGDDFCLGGDRDEYDLMAREDPTGRGVQLIGAKARRVIESLTGSPAVTIARLQGRVTGAGLGLAIACDLRVGADTATFRLPELALGMPLAWGGALPRLIHEMGAARLRELVLTSRAFDAEEALHLSVLQKVVPEDSLDEAVARWVAPVLRRPEMALRITKALLSSYAAPTRLADPTALDAELLAAVVAARHHTTAAP